MVKTFAVISFLFAVLIQNASSQSDLCDVIEIPNCRGITKQLRRNTFQTAPSTSTAVNINPANVSFDRGVGLDMSYQPNNPVLFGLTSGTGKMGGALISGSLDNTFFGNRTPELFPVFLARHEEKKQYANKKLSFALGGKLFSSKSVGFDFGVILKRHSEIRKINTGVGFSGRLWKIHFGASVFKDDMFIDLKVIDPRNGSSYSSLYGKDYLHEDFTVTTYTLGTRVRNLSLDFGTIKSDIDYFGRPTVILIYSASFNYENFLFNLASRKEQSQALEYDGEILVTKENKSQIYGGLQYSINKHIILGAHYNYYLLKEPSVSATFFL